MTTTKKKAGSRLDWADENTVAGAVPCPQSGNGGARETERFLPAIGRGYENKSVRAVLNGYTSPKWLRQAKAMRVWSIYDSVKEAWPATVTEPNGGFYTFASCERRCAALNKAIGKGNRHGD